MEEEGAESAGKLSAPWRGCREEDGASGELHHASLLVATAGLAASIASSASAHSTQPTALLFSWITVYYLAFHRRGSSGRTLSPTPSTWTNTVTLTAYEGQK